MQQPPSGFEVGARFDADGVLMYDYGHLYGNAGWQYSPYDILAYAISLYDRSCPGPMPEKDRTKFLAQVNWLKKAAVQKNGGAAWTYNFPNEVYRAPANWISAFAQGLALSVLSRADQVDPEPWHHELGVKVVHAFELSVNKGGVRATAPGLLYVGVAFPGATNSILNESLFGDYGLFEFAHAFNDAAAWNLFIEGMENLGKWLGKFDLGWRSKYDLAGNVAEDDYNEVHVRQLTILGDILREIYGTHNASSLRGVVSHYANRFALYSTSLPFALVGSLNLSPPAEFAVDLGGQHQVAAIELRVGDVPPDQRATRVDVYGSDDGQRWTMYAKNVYLNWYGGITGPAKTGFALNHRLSRLRFHFNVQLAPAGSTISFSQVVVRGQ